MYVCMHMCMYVCMPVLDLCYVVCIGLLVRTYSMYLSYCIISFLEHLKMSTIYLHIHVHVVVALKSMRFSVFIEGFDIL